MQNRSAHWLIPGSILTMMVLFSILSYFDRTILSVAGAGIMKEFQFSETQLGMVHSAFIFGYAIMMIPGGYLSDRFGPTRTLIGMGLGAGLFSALTALGGKSGLGSLFGVLAAFLVIRFLLGVSTAPLYPACAKMNSNWFPVRRQAFVWGLVAAGAGIGSALSPSLFAWMISTFGWRISFVLAGGITASLALVWAAFAFDPPTQPFAAAANRVNTASSSPTAFLGTLRNRDVRLLSFGYLTVGYFEYIFFFWIYYYFQQIRHLSAKETSLFSTVIFLAWVVLCPLGGWISDTLVKTLGARRGRPIVPVLGVLLGAMLLLVGTHLSQPWAIGIAFALSLGLTSASDGPFWKATIEAGGDQAGAACGVLNTGSNIGGFIAPVLTPYLASFFGWNVALLFACAVASGGAVIWFFLGTYPANVGPRPALVEGV